MTIPKIGAYHLFLKDKYLILFDQALLSVINFGSILLLSKLADIATFGNFVITYSYSYFIFIFSTYLLAAPILVFLAKKWEQEEGIYLWICVLTNLIINLIFSAILFYFLQQQIPEVYFVNFFLLSLGMSSFEVVKKFVFSSRSIPVKYGLFSTILLNILFFTLLFALSHTLSVNSILEVYAISFFSGFFFVLFFSFQLGIFKKVSRKSAMAFNFFSEVIRTHYRYSKWIILGGIAFWGYTQGIYILAKYFEVSDFMIGKVRTLQNLLGVFNILLIALENHYTPIFSKESLNGGFQNVQVHIRKLFKENYLKFLGLFVVAIPVGLMFYNFLFSEKYGSGTTIFLMFLGVQFVLLIIRPLGIALKSVEKTIPFFISHILAAGMIPLLLYSFLKLEMNNALAWTIAIANVIYAGYIALYYLNKKSKI